VLNRARGFVKTLFVFQRAFFQIRSQSIVIASRQERKQAVRSLVVVKHRFSKSSAVHGAESVQPQEALMTFRALAGCRRSTGAPVSNDLDSLVCLTRTLSAIRKFPFLRRFRGQALSGSELELCTVNNSAASGLLSYPRPPPCAAE
jgi:hypothetical protein